MVTSAATQDAVEVLFDILQGPIRWQLLETGLKLGLFEHLTQAVSAEQLALLCGYETEPCRCWLNAMAAMGLVEHSDDKYRLNSHFSSVLGGGKSESLKPVLLHLAQLRHGSVEQIQAALEGNLPQHSQQHVSHTIAQAAFWKKASAHLQAFHRTCATEVAVSVLTSLPEWSQVRSVLDIGAGSAELAKSLLGVSPDLHCTLFDLPEPLQQIRQCLAAEEQQAFSWCEGDYNHTPLPTDMDVIWASMSLYYADDLNILMQKIHSSLRTGGVFVSVHEGLNRQRTQPVEHVINRFMPALNGRDVSFEYGEIASAMSKAGFRQIISRRLMTPYGRFELDLAYV